MSKNDQSQKNNSNSTEENSSASDDIFSQIGKLMEEGDMGSGSSGDVLGKCLDFFAKPEMKDYMNNMVKNIGDNIDIPNLPSAKALDEEDSKILDMLRIMNKRLARIENHLGIDNGSSPTMSANTVKPKLVKKIIKKKKLIDSEA